MPLTLYLPRLPFSPNVLGPAGAGAHCRLTISTGRWSLRNSMIERMAMGHSKSRQSRKPAYLRRAAGQGRSVPRWHHEH